MSRRGAKNTLAFPSSRDAAKRSRKSEQKWDKLYTAITCEFCSAQGEGEGGLSKIAVFERELLFMLRLVFVPLAVDVLPARSSPTGFRL